MNKKIVFSLVALSSFAFARSELVIDGSDDCLNYKTLDALKKCTTLRKNNQGDKFYIQCVSNQQDISDSSSGYHLINILTQQSSVYKNPEKVRYEALRQCGISYFDSRMYSAYKAQKKFNTYNSSDYNNFIKSYRRIVSEKRDSASSNCKDVLNKELEYIDYHANNSLDDLDFTPYFKTIGYSVPEIHDFKTSKIFNNKQIQLKTNLSNSDRKIMQEYYKEFKTYTTGKVVVSSSMSNINNQYLVYLLDQQEPLVEVNGGWYPDVFRHFTNLIGDYTLSDNGIVKGKGCNYLQDQFNPNENPRREDSNKLIYIDERYTNLSMQGVCDVFRGFHERLEKNKYDYKRAIESLMLKNSKVKPYNINDYFADYNDSSGGFRTNDYRGGINKCYNYDLENFTSKYSRANYFDWKNERDFVKDEAKSDWERKFYVFSIHKQNGTHNGVFSNDEVTSKGEELKVYNFSVNVRPAPFSSTQNTVINGLEVKFIPDANEYTIKDIDNPNRKNTTKPLRINNLDNVYIGLNNNKISFNAQDRETERVKSVEYALTKVKITKQKISDVNGKINSQPVEFELSYSYDDAPKLIKKDGINEFGLGFTKGAFRTLARFSDSDFTKDGKLPEGDMYQIKFQPLEIVEKVVETNKLEVCPTGVCKLEYINRQFIRPMFQASGKDIIKGSPKGSVEIILGSGAMPKTTLGTAYNSNNTNSDVIVNGNISNGYAIADKIYTRTNQQNIYLGLKVLNTSTVYPQYVKFFQGDNELDANLYAKLNRIQRSNDKCIGYYPISDEMIIALNNKLPIGQQYKISYKIAEYDETAEDCVVLGDKESNVFAIRPESIEYKVNSLEKFDKNAGKVDSKYTDNNVTFTSNKDDRFGIGVAELRVSDSKAKELKFYLEDENSNQLKAPSKNPYFANFSSNGEFKIKTVFPMVTDAKIVFSENKFTINDLKEELCTNNDSALDITSANTIQIDGKINCQTPGNELQVNFIANEELGFAYNEKLGLKRDKLNILAFSDDDNDQLLFPVQLQNKVNDGRMDKYFYKKYTSDVAKVKYDFYATNISLENFNKILERIDNPKDIVIEKFKRGVDNTKGFLWFSFEVKGLNQGFDTKLAALNKDEKLSGYDESLFDASEFGKVKLSLRYPKKTNNIFNQLPKFVITDKSKASFNINGTVMERTLDKNYDVAFTALKFKDISCKPSKTTNCFKDSISLGKVQFVYFDETNKEKAIKTKDNSETSRVVYDGNLIDLASNVDYVADYGTKITTLDYQFDKKYTNQTYIKDSIKVVPTKGNSYLDANVSFTIEVDSRK